MNRKVYIYLLMMLMICIFILAYGRAAAHDFGDDFSDSPTNAQALVIGTPMAGCIEVDADRDWFAFPASAFKLYTVTVATGTIWDCALGVKGADGVSTLAETNTVAASPALVVVTNAGPATTFYARVAGFADFTTGTYSIAVSESSIPLDDYIINRLPETNGGYLVSSAAADSGANTAANLTDANSNTFWRSVSNPAGEQEFLYSFVGYKAVSINGVNIYNSEGGAGQGHWSLGYRISTSLDGATFAEIASGTLAPDAAGQVIGLPASNILARFVKFAITSGADTAYWSLGELELYGTLVSDTNLPSVGTVSAPVAVTDAFPIVVMYTNASDAGFSGLKDVELWCKSGAGGAWTNTGMTQTGSSGSFNFNGASVTGTYYFGLRAEDWAGNRSTTPSGSGDIAVVYDTVKRPDFIISGIALNPAVPLAGSLFSAQVTIRNQGNATGLPGIVYIWTNMAVYAAVKTAANKKIPGGSSMAPGSNRVLTIKGLPAGATGTKTFRAFVDGAGTAAEASEDNNQFALRYDVRNKPDLKVTGITLIPAVPLRGGKFDAKVTVRNDGSAYASNVLVSVWVNRAAIATNNAGADQERRAFAIAPKASTALYFTGLDAGTMMTKRTFRAFADSDMTLDEILESNNQMVRVYTPVSRPDFIITEISLDPTNPPVAGSFIANVTVKNTGYISGNAGYVDVWTDKATNVIPGAKLQGDKFQLVGTLNVNAAKLLTFTGLNAGTNPVTKVFRAVVDSRGKTVEIVETNNQATLNYTVGGP